MKNKHDIKCIKVFCMQNVVVKIVQKKLIIIEKQFYFLIKAYLFGVEVFLTE